MKLRGVFILASLALGGYAWCMHKRSIVPRVLNFDAVFSACEQDAIAREIANGDCLCLKFPSISHISANSHPDHQEITVYGWQPVARINKQNLLVANGAILSAHSYHESILQTLPSMEIPNVAEVCTQQILACIQTADAATWSDGTVTWLRPSYIEFKIHDPEVLMVCTSEQLQSTAGLVGAVREVWQQQSVANYDVRFEKQIIAYGNSQNLKKGQGESHV